MLCGALRILAVCATFAVASAVPSPVTSRPPSTLIGLVGPMTGSLASYGQAMERGADLAVRAINAEGSLLDGDLRLLVRDDRCDQERATSVAKELVAEGVSLVVGHFCSSASIAAAPIYAAAGVVQISPASSNGKLTDAQRWPTLFRLTYRDDWLGYVAGRDMARWHESAPIALVSSGSGLALVYEESVGFGLHHGGAKAVETFRFAERADFAPLVAELQSRGVEAVFFAGYHEDAARFALAAEAAGLSARIYAGDTLATEQFLLLAKSAADRVWFLAGHDLGLLPGADEVPAELGRGRPEIDVYALNSFVALSLWSEAAAATGSTEADAVARMLHQKEWPTPFGQVRFEDDGDVVGPALVQWFTFQDGAIRAVHP